MCESVLQLVSNVCVCVCVCVVCVKTCALALSFLAEKTYAACSLVCYGSALFSAEVCHRLQLFQLKAACGAQSLGFVSLSPSVGRG